MKNISTMAITCLVLVALALSGVAFAHGTEKHGNKAATDAQMKKMHDMMPMFSIASAELETAIAKGDAAAALVQADKIKAAIPDLKKSKPHKNTKQLKKFVELATNFDKAVATTVDLVKKGDFAGAKAAFENAEKACADCHAKFRN